MQTEKALFGYAVTQDRHNYLVIQRGFRSPNQALFEGLKHIFSPAAAGGGLLLIVFLWRFVRRVLVPWGLSWLDGPVGFAIYAGLAVLLGCVVILLVIASEDYFVEIRFDRRMGKLSYLSKGFFKSTSDEYPLKRFRNVRAKLEKELNSSTMKLAFITTNRKLFTVDKVGLSENEVEIHETNYQCICAKIRDFMDWKQ